MALSVIGGPASIVTPPSWRCPDCRTVQTETMRCWRCSRPAYTCETCHSYRPSVAADLGYCANDPERTPLAAGESRPCWESAADAAMDPPSSWPAGGLFAGLEITPTGAPMRPSAGSSKPDAARPAATRPASRPPRPPLEAPGRAAWAAPDTGELVEAPHVEPGRRLTTELQRRLRHSRR